ncbi:MAG: S-layer family protein [Synechococcales bacterium]|nr:S-layer family protein [Synechococcales bacterium]
MVLLGKRLIFFVVCCCSFIEASIPNAEAQIIPDTTLPSPSRVVQTGDRSFAITNGTRTGNNLFHSFTEFSIPNRNLVSFQGIDPDIERIISRVTGNSRSTIDGAIEALQIDGTRSPADFFLINPNGIVFGSDASLNIGGSFIATTAERLVFEDGTTFGVGDASDNPLLTVSVPIGLQFGQRPRTIRVTQDGVTPGNPGFLVPTGLQVAPEQTLALVGGPLDISGGVLNAQEGRLELGSVAGFEQVALIQGRQGLRLGFSGVEAFRDISIGEQSLLNVTGERAGSIHVWGRSLSISGSSAILANTVERGDRPGITLQASSLQLSEGATLSTTNFGRGRGGGIQIRADDLTIQSGAQVFANVASGAAGQGGSIRVTTDTLQISGGQLLDLGPPNPDLEAGEESNFRSSGIRAVVLEDATGQAGNIQIRTDILEILDGGQIAADTRGLGDAGNIIIQANDASLVGVAFDDNNQPLFSNALTIPSTISAAAFERSEGQGGDVFLAARTLQVLGGATLQTSTVGEGNAGNLNLRVAENTELSGTTGNFRGGLFSFSGGIPGDRFSLGESDAVRQTATGQGGEITLQTGTLVVRDRAVIAVGSLNPSEQAAGSGNITIQAEQVRLEEQGNLLSATASGDGGDISVLANNFLLLRQNSLIESTAGIEAAGGDGGNVILSTDFVLAALQENSDIQANAFTGRGGQVTITTQGIFGIAPRLSATAQSDITASSAFGIDGIITVEDLGIDPVQRVAELPNELAAPPLNQECQVAGSQTTGRFVTTYRGGLPPSPTDPLNSASLWEDIRPPTSEGLPAAVTEAQGWQVDRNGIIVLTAGLSSTRPIHSCLQ